MTMAGQTNDFFAYFQIAALALFFLLFAGQTLHLRVHKHINAITLSLGKKGLLGVMEVALFVEVNAWVLVVLIYSLPLKIQPMLGLFGVRLLDLFLLKIMGVLVIALALLAAVVALTALGDSWRLGLDEKAPGKLITTGIYALSRNPIYLFFDVYFIGTFLLNGALLFLGFALLTIANLHYQILQEEKFLASVHGLAYEDYRTRTARYFTWRRTATVHGQCSKPLEYVEQ